eukprot:scaffold7330_cov277-Pinguiococcus_pyrenoidosus.AAC.2
MPRGGGLAQAFVVVWYHRQPAVDPAIVRVTRQDGGRDPQLCQHRFAVWPAGAHSCFRSLEACFGQLDRLVPHFWTLARFLQVLHGGSEHLQVHSAQAQLLADRVAGMVLAHFADVANVGGPVGLDQRVQGALRSIQDQQRCEQGHSHCSGQPTLARLACADAFGSTPAERERFGVSDLWEASMQHSTHRISYNSDARDERQLIRSDLLCTERLKTRRKQRHRSRWIVRAGEAMMLGKSKSIPHLLATGALGTLRWPSIGGDGQLKARILPLSSALSLDWRSASSHILRSTISDRGLAQQNFAKMTGHRAGQRKTFAQYEWFSGSPVGM